MHPFKCLHPSSSLSYYSHSTRSFGRCLNQVPRIIIQQNPIFLHRFPPKPGDRLKARTVMRAMDNNQPESPASPKFSTFPWKNWLVAIIFSMILPCFKYRSKWGPLLALKSQVDENIETVELVTQVVEKVAEKVEKVTDEAADRLSDDTKLKEAVELVENLAEETVTKTEQAEELIHKIEEMEEEAERKIIDPDLPQAKVDSPRSSIE